MKANLKISTEINSTARHVGEERAIEMLAKAGFDAWDFSMFKMCEYNHETKTYMPMEHPLSGKDYLTFARRLKQVGLDNGIVCNQSHAPFPVKNRDIYSYLKRAIECTAEAGGEICVIHPDNDKGPEENAEMYFELLPFAKECGIKIAAENMYNWNGKHALFAACATPKSFCEHLELVNSENLVACLDIGHAEMYGSDTTAVEMIHALGPKLQALHIHDNDKVNDSHQIPFSMDIDFEPITKALHDINYTGYYTLESGVFLRAYTEETIFEGVQKFAEAAARFARMSR